MCLDHGQACLCKLFINVNRTTREPSPFLPVPPPLLRDRETILTFPAVLLRSTPGIRCLIIHNLGVFFQRALLFSLCLLRYSPIFVHSFSPALFFFFFGDKMKLPFRGSCSCSSPALLVRMAFYTDISEQALE